MRIIAGIRKGLKLKAPDGINTRPTTDRVKESVFNIIQSYIPTERVLDLFAGSGAMGLEALSRRCGHCTFVEKDRDAAALVRHNISLAKFEDNASVVISDSIKFLEGISSPFGIIFLDPPYNKGLFYPVLDLISKKGLLEPNGIVVAETEKNGEDVIHSDFTVVRNAVYGKTQITILRRGEA